jgi:ethanolamine utilization protein EutA (predicted chaperonin)
VEEVTAGHEMLHAAYDRLSPSEKERINGLLEDAYSRITDQRLRQNVASYESRDPSVVLNELHSILGTEVRNLPKDLETYYGRYFDDRGKVLTLAEAYASEFAAREDKIKAYDVQLSSINGEIVRYQIDLKDRNKSLQTQKQEINGLKTEPSAYNKAVTLYNKEVNAYNAIVEKVKGLVDSYNKIVADRNLIAVEERDLVQAIDTRADQL